MEIQNLLGYPEVSDLSNGYGKNPRIRNKNFGVQAEQLLIFWVIFPITG